MDKNFFWGAATSAHQVEGNNRNDWTEWEKSESRIKDLESKIQNGEFRKKLPPHLWSKWPTPADLNNYISGKACEHYNRFREDFDIAKSLGHNAHRFSIEWSRIEPEEGKFDEKEVTHYREIIKALRERGIEPFVTLWHFTLPLWVTNLGGWESSKTIFYFSRYCERMCSAFKGEVRYWMTLNEPAEWAAQAYLYDLWPPQKRNFLKNRRVYFNLLKAHKEAYTRMKTVGSNLHVGIAKSMEWWEPGWTRPLIHYLRNYFFLDRISRHLDFVGLNYYQRKCIFRKPSGEVSDMGWESYPDGMYYFLLKSWRRWQKPIYITENGIANAKDDKRAKFIKDHIAAMRRAMKEGADVRGYFHWSLLDNFEWDSGFWPRFGLVEVNYKTQERKIRESAKVYQEIILNSRF